MELLFGKPRTKWDRYPSAAVLTKGPTELRSFSKGQHNPDYMPLMKRDFAFNDKKRAFPFVVKNLMRRKEMRAPGFEPES